MKILYDKYRNLRSLIKLLIYRLIYKERLNCGKNVYARKGFIILIEEKGKVEIGDECFFNNYCSINSLIGVKIGNNCIFGENVHIYDHNHIYKDDEKPINEQGFSYGEVTIGDNSWIGSNVVILKGVHIGEHCVIGTGCIIYKDIPKGSVIINKQSLSKSNRDK